MSQRLGQFDLLPRHVAADRIRGEQRIARERIQEFGRDFKVKVSPFCAPILRARLARLNDRMIEYRGRERTRICRDNCWNRRKFSKAP